MPITEAQKKARKSHIGSSDMAAIYGLNPWRSPEDVRLEKTGRLEDKDQDLNTDMRLGNELELPLIRIGGEDLEADAIELNVEISGPKPFLLAHLDSLLLYRDGADPAKKLHPRENRCSILEIKTSGLTRPLSNPEEWGDPGTDDVPFYNLIQLHYQTAIARKIGFKLQDENYILALLGGRGLNMYCVQSDHELEETLLSFAQTWWQKHVLEDQPCGSKHEISPDIFKRLRRQPNLSIDIDGSAVFELEAIKKAISENEKKKKQLQEKILEQLGDAEMGVFDGGQLTYFKQKRAAYQVKEQEYRVMRVKLDK